MGEIVSDDSHQKISFIVNAFYTQQVIMFMYRLSIFQNKYPKIDFFFFFKSVQKRSLRFYYITVLEQV